MEVAFQSSDLVEMAHAHHGCHCTASALDDQVFAHLSVAHQPGKATGCCLGHGDSMGLKSYQTHDLNCTGICADDKGQSRAQRTVDC